MVEKASPTIPGYWCECAVDTPPSEFGSTTVAAFEAYSADQAIGWVLSSLSRLETNLTPEDSRAVSNWLLQGYGQSVKELRDSQALEFSICQGKTRIEWTIRRVIFLRLVDPNEGPPPDYIEVTPIEVRMISR
jgi:hypothetical protein